MLVAALGLSLALAPTSTDAVELGGEPDAPAAEGGPRELLVTEVAVGASLGLTLMNVRETNDVWGARGLPLVAPLQWTPLAITGELWLGRHVPGLDIVELQNLKGREESGPRTRFDSLTMGLSYGYAVVHRPKGYSLMPRVGVALADATQRVRQAGAGTLDDLLSDPGGDLTVSKTSAQLDLALENTYLISFGRRDKLGLGSGIRIGFRVGGHVQLWNFAKKGETWKADGDPVTGVGDVRLDGVYARLIVMPSLLHRSVKPPEEKRRR